MINQRVVLITGGTQGIGADLVRGFLAQGDAVVIADIAQDRGTALVQALQALNPDSVLRFIATDIQDDVAIDECVAQVMTQFGRLDVLVNNACVYEDAGLASTRAQWHHTLDVNLISAALFTQKVAPHMRSGAVVINMASIGGKVAAMGRLLYPASKAAMLQLTKSVAVELAPQGIRVVAVSPAWTWSPALATMANNQREQADAVGAITHPLGRVADGAEVANVVCFLASAQASWITGVDIPVDGGFSVLGPDQGKGPRYWFQKAQDDDLQAID